MGCRSFSIRALNLRGTTDKKGLDRVVANRGWCEAYPNVMVVVGAAICSNHSPLMVDTDALGERT